MNKFFNRFIAILTASIISCPLCDGQSDTLYFFDFEDVHIEYNSIGSQNEVQNNGGAFKDAGPYLPFGKTVIRPRGSLRTTIVEKGPYNVGEGYLYHSPTWFLNKLYEGISFNHVELALDTPIPAGRFYKLSFLIGNFKTHRYKPSHYGVRFSEIKIIKPAPGALLSEPDIFFDFKKDQELDQIQAIFYAETDIKYIYFGCFVEDSSRISKSYTSTFQGLSYSDTAAYIEASKPTRVALDNILIKEIRKEDIKFSDIYFETNADEIHTPPDLKLIKEIAKYLTHQPQNYLLIQGFTDQTGSIEYNLGLSSRRAEWIKKKLVAEKVDEDKIVTFGKGIHNLTALQKDNRFARKVSFLVFQ